MKFKWVYNYGMWYVATAPKHGKVRWHNPLVDADTIPPFLWALWHRLRDRA